MFEEGDLILRYGGVSTSTGRWIRVTSSLLLGRDDGSDGCWVPASDLVLGRGTGHFLQLADGLLSAEVSPTLDELLAVHNLFGDWLYREQVEASALLNERRRDLLVRAVEVAQRPQRDGRRPVDDNPLILAWLEALTEPLRYSKGSRGEDTWTLDAVARALETEPSTSRGTEPATRRGGRGLAIIAPDVACRERPSRTAWSWTTLPTDFHFQTQRADTTVAGDTWVFVRQYGCWVLAAHTAVGGTDEHVLVIADRFLTSGEAWSFDNSLRVLTVLSSRTRGHREEVEALAILGLRRLQVLRGALRHLSPGDADVLVGAWIKALGEEVTVGHEGHIWTVSDEAYLNLYEEHLADPFAEEILWEYASESVRRDCEGEFVCSLREDVINRLAQYWIDFPNGRHIAEAVEEARSLVGRGLASCKAARGVDLDLKDVGWSGWDRAGAELTREMLATLAEVQEEDKAPLLEELAELEACAP